MDYRKVTKDTRKAWLVYKAAQPTEANSVIDFVAGFNAAINAFLEAAEKLSTMELSDERKSR